MGKKVSSYFNANFNCFQLLKIDLNPVFVRTITVYSPSFDHEYFVHYRSWFVDSRILRFRFVLVPICRQKFNQLNFSLFNHVHQKHRLIFCIQPPSNDLKLFPDRWLVPWQRHLDHLHHIFYKENAWCSTLRRPLITHQSIYIANLFSSLSWILTILAIKFQNVSFLFSPIFKP